MTWHSGLVPSDEIWLKFGGDKGEGSFKMAFEIANLLKPNSTKNTVVFSAFEAQDSPHNVKLALDHYKDDLDNLQIENGGIV
ncbi:MAG: hypothetical protein DSY43_00335 [Gammaproteobacteria bacterium]|nr:MAG: hypothetical protein DSY43_00335 [Gammaproteobacteria bacterium]